MTHETKLIWHDLTEDPMDLPKTGNDNGYEYLITRKNTPCVLFDGIYRGNGIWGWDDDEGYISDYEPGEIIAWAEPIEPYRPTFYKKTMVFISLPMSGRTDSDIRADIHKAKEAYLDLTGMDIQDVVFVTNLDADLANELCVNYRDYSGTLGSKDKDAVWYLGSAITRLAKCDEIFFWGNWGAARGCLIEHSVAKKYHIPIVYGTNWTEEKFDSDRNAFNRFFGVKDGYLANRFFKDYYKNEPKGYFNHLVNEALHDLENKELRGEDKDGDKL